MMSETIRYGTIRRCCALYSLTEGNTDLMICINAEKCNRRDSIQGIHTSDILECQHLKLHSQLILIRQHLLPKLAKKLHSRSIP